MAQSIDGLYQQLEAATPIHDYFLVLKEGIPALEKKGDSCLVTLYKKALGTSYVIEDACKQILDLVVKKKENLNDSLEAIELGKICITIQEIISHVIQKRLSKDRLKDTLCLQQIFNQLTPLELGFIIHAAIKNGISPFLCACTYGMFPQAISLIDKTTDLKKASKYYTELLATAYQKNEQGLCLELIRLGANPQRAFKTNASLCINSLLATAIGKRDTSISLQLINSGTDLNCPINAQGERVLHLACKEGLQEVVRILCVKGAGCNVQDNQGNTALHAACRALQIDIALFLTAHSADASIVNHNGLSAFSLPSLRIEVDLREKVKLFYMTLFKDIPFARDKIPSTSFTSFITTCHSKPKDLAKESVRASPFEVPLLLQDKVLAKKLSAQFSQKEFIASFEKLRQKFPHTTLDLIEFSHLSLHLGHLQYKLPELLITAPENLVHLHDLFELFEKITFTRQKSPYFLDPNSLKSEIKNRSYIDLRALISQVIDRVENRIEFIGTPRKGTVAIDKFYETIENSLKSIIVFFQQAPEEIATAHLLVSFFSELLFCANECAGRYFLTAVMEYTKICKGVVASFEEEILLSLAEYRKLLLHTCIDQADEHSASQYNFVLRDLGKELGISEASIMSSYIDQYGWANTTQVKQRFFELYTPQNVQREWIEPLFKDNSHLKEKFIDWKKAHIPTNWKKEITEDRNSLYLATEVFDMHTGSIKSSAITDFLLRMTPSIYESSLI